MNVWARNSPRYGDPLVKCKKFDKVPSSQQCYAKESSDNGGYYLEILKTVVQNISFFDFSAKFLQNIAYGTTVLDPPDAPSQAMRERNIY